MRLVLVVALLAAGCVDKAAEAKKKQDATKAAFDAEAKAQAEADAKQAKADFDADNQACTAGDGAKCVDLAKMYADGKGVDKDAGKAKDLLAKACGMKSKEACRSSALAEGDAQKKLGFETSLCDLGEAEGCVEGAKLADGLALTAKKPTDRPAMVLLKKACALNAAIACTARGVGLVNDDPKEAVDSFTKGCDDGEPTSCFQLSELYKNGKGVKKKDAAKATELKKKACDAGLKDACGA
jgi:TPR repeat protein